MRTCEQQLARLHLTSIGTRKAAAWDGTSPRSCFPGGRPTHPPTAPLHTWYRTVTPKHTQSHLRTVPYLFKAPPLDHVVPAPSFGSALACMPQMMPQSSVTPVYLEPYSICSERSASLLPSRRKHPQPVQGTRMTPRDLCRRLGPIRLPWDPLGLLTDESTSQPSR